MKMPPHLGTVLKTLFLELLALNVTEAAKILDMPRSALSEIVNGRRAISPQVALKIDDTVLTVGKF